MEGARAQLRSGCAHEPRDGSTGDGGLYRLAKYIARLRGKCRWVWCFYFGDFDTNGCVIDRVVFGDDSAPESDRMARHGKLRCILYDFFDGLDDDFPNLIYQRIGATADPKIIRQVFRTDQLTFTDS